MNILDGVRLANRSAAIGATGVAVSSGIAIGAAASVMSIAQAITGTRDIEQERELMKAARKVQDMAMSISRRERQANISLTKSEISTLQALAVGARQLIKTGLHTVGSWFVRTVVAGIRYAVIPMFNVIRFAAGTLFRMVLVNPWVLGTFAAAGAAYATYRQFFKPVEETPSKDDMVKPVQPAANERAPTTDTSSVEEAKPSVDQTTPQRFADAEPIAPATKPAESTDKPVKQRKLSAAGSANKEVLERAMDAHGITDKTERAAFLAQMDHESRGFSAMEETGSSAYFKKYENRKNLGNTEKGDGEKYKGRGFIQLTGRANYGTYGAKLGVDLLNKPWLASDPDLAAKIALQYWDDRGLGKKARAGDFDGVTRGINGGLNGKADRDQKYKMYLDLAKGGNVDAVTAKAAKGGLQIPTYGRLSSSYGTRVDPVSGKFERKHQGIDIAAPSGTPIYATTSGKARVNPNTKGGYGNLLEILGDAYDTRYAHLSSFDVKDGESVTQGQVVAKVGNTGRSTGDHLHFEIRDKKGNDIDPASVMALPKKQIDKSMVVPIASNRNVDIIQRDGQIIKLES